jgi:hypothetical protein
VVVAPTTASGRDRPPIASNGPANAIPCEVEGDLAARRKVHCEYSLSLIGSANNGSCQRKSDLRVLVRRRIG